MTNYRGAPNEQYILWLRQEWRKADQKAREASDKWNKRSEELTRWLNGLEGTTLEYQEQARREKKSKDWQLEDAFSSWSFWEREANRLKHTMQAELACEDWLYKRNLGTSEFETVIPEEFMSVPKQRMGTE